MGRISEAIRVKQLDNYCPTCGLGAKDCNCHIKSCPFCGSPDIRDVGDDLSECLECSEIFNKDETH